MCIMESNSGESALCKSCEYEFWNRLFICSHIRIHEYKVFYWALYQKEANRSETEKKLSNQIDLFVCLLCSNERSYMPGCLSVTYNKLRFALVVFTAIG